MLERVGGLYIKGEGITFRTHHHLNDSDFFSTSPASDSSRKWRNSSNVGRWPLARLPDIVLQGQAYSLPFESQFLGVISLNPEPYQLYAAQPLLCFVGHTKS